MFKNYLKLAFRNAFKYYKSFSLINILGLAIGMASCILILLWVQDELSFDRFHQHTDELYRVELVYNNPTGISRVGVTPMELTPYLKENCPEVINASRYLYRGKPLIRYNEKRFQDIAISLVDPAFLEIFTFPLVKGDPRSVLAGTNSVVITEKISRRIFGTEDPIGKTLNFNQQDFTVTGVLEDIPDNSHLKFDCLIPFESLSSETKKSLKNWGKCDFYTYILLQKNSDYREFNRKISDLRIKHHPSSKGKLFMNPITRIHLYHDHLDFIAAIENPGNIKYVYIFSALAIFLLLIACINFMNLTTAQSSKRAKEIGMRKVVGAHKIDIIKQFFGESILSVVLALVLAVFLVELFLPNFSAISGKELSLKISEIDTLWQLIGITLITGLISGSYPALVLSSFKPIKILKGGTKSFSTKGFLGRFLVLIQFTLSIIAIIGSIVIFNQLDYVRNTDLGYDKNNIVYIPLHSGIRGKYEFIKSELLKNKNILSVSVGTMPIESIRSTEIWDWDGKDPEQKISVHPIIIDDDYLETLKINIVKGRGFSKEFPTDFTNGYLVNEEAVKVMGMDDPVGKRLAFRGKEGRIIGVVKDFHYGSLHSKIGPAVFLFEPPYFLYACAKINPQNISETIRYLENTWGKHFPQYSFRYYFLEETIDNFYKAERRMSTILNYFTFLAIFISCIGLFALSLYLTQRRTKEIGIRKVWGAKVSNIIFLLSGDLAKWVLIANLIGWPIAYDFMNKWLQNFAYRTSLTAWIFLLTGLLSMLLTILTISYHTIKAASVNPIEILRYE